MISLNVFTAVKTPHVYIRRGEQGVHRIVCTLTFSELYNGPDIGLDAVRRVMHVQLRLKRIIPNEWRFR